MERFAIIIGAMKSGTTSLFHYLSQHPRIAACHEKEPDFFSNPENFAKGLDWYRNLWDWVAELHDIASGEIDTERIYNRGDDRVVSHPLWRRLERIGPLERIVGELVPDTITRRLFESLGSPAERQTLSAGAREMLRFALADDIRRLRDHWDVDVASWNIDIS